MRHAFILLAACTGLFFLFLHPVSSSDFFHHIATGRDIILTGALPRVDTWTFTAQGLPWIAHSWRSGVLYYVIHSLFGYEGISVFFALVGVATTAFLYLTLLRLRISQTLALLICFTTAAFISLRWPSRPEVMAPFFISLLFFVLPLLKHKRLAFAIPGIFWLWSALYGSSVFMGIALLAYVITVSRAWKKREILIFLLSVLTSFGNGYGWRSFFYIFTIPKIAGNVGEWLPVTAALDPGNPGVVFFYQYQFLIYGLVCGTTTALLIWTLAKKRELITRQLLFAGPAVGLLAPFFAVRFINLAPLLAAPLTALALTSLPPKPKRVFVLTFLALGIGAAAVRLATYPVGTRLASVPFQSTAIEYLVSHRIKGNVYTSQELGAFIHWRIPDAKVFYDTRDDLYTTTTIPSDLSKLIRGQTDLRTILRTYKADIVVAEADQEILTPLLYVDTWKLVHVGDSQLVFVRTALANALSLQTFDALDPTRSPPAKPGRLPQAKEEMKTILHERESAEHYIRMADILLALGETDEAVGYMEQAQLNDFLGMSAPLVHLGLAEIQAKFYLAARRCGEAHTALIAADRYRRRPFLFSPNNQLFSTINRYWGQYYIDCDRNVPLAREYLLKYAAQTGNSRERKVIESLLDTLVQ